MNNNIKMMLSDKKIQKQFFKYIFIGASTALIELLLFAFFRRILYVNIKLSNILAVITATVLNFSINKGWTFKSSNRLYRSLLLYIILFVFNTSFSTFTIAFLAQHGVLDICGKLITMILITAWNFVIYRKIIFK